MPPIYDRTKGQALQTHEKPYWRFALESMPVHWDDLIQGPMSYDVRHISDPVVMRHDGSMSYLLSSVIDDVDMDITHIIRGADHVTNTAVQIQMMQALKKAPPAFAHFPLMFDEAGEKYSKRSGSTAIDQLRQEGWLPLAIIQALSQLGLSRRINGSFSEIAAGFTLSEYGKSNAKFSMQDIQNAQMRLFASMDYDALPVPERTAISKELWLIIRENILTLGDIASWDRICSDTQWRPDPGARNPGVCDASIESGFFETALEQLSASQALIPNEHATEGWTWVPEAWHLWVNALAGQCPELKKGVLCKSLRYALTGQSAGPKMEYLLPLMSPNVVRSRLSGNQTP
jgi:glutamyl-tRNA synthetase